MKAVLEVQNLSYRYPDGTNALTDVSFSMQPGERVGLIGPNGSGKSTLLLHLNGVLPHRPADAAGVRVEGTVLSSASLFDIRRKVGLLFQDPDDQLFCPTVHEDVAFGPKQFGDPPATIDAIVRSALQSVGLEGFDGRSPHHLSGGEKQRVCLAGVLACKPALLALDEPTNNLDPRGRRDLRELLKSIPAAMLIASHDLEMVVELCPRTIILDGGKKIADGSTIALLADESLMLKHGLEKPHSLQHRHPHT